MSATLPHLKFLTAKRLVTSAAVLTIGSMLVIASISYRMAEVDLSATSSGPTRIEITQGVLSALKDAEAAHHGYLLTGNNSYIDLYETARSAVNEKIGELKVKSPNVEGVESEGLTVLRELVNTKLAEMGDTLEIRRHSGLAPAIEAIKQGEQKNTLERVRKVILSFQSDDLRREATQDQQTKAKALFHQNLTIGLVGLDLLFLVAMGVLGMKINRLQNLVTVCAWSQKVEYDGKWIRFEEFLQKRFGIQVSHGISLQKATEFLAEEEKGAANIIQLKDAFDAQIPAASKAIHSIRNHLTAVFCLSTEVTQARGKEEKRSSELMAHAEEIANQVDAIDAVLRHCNVRKPVECGIAG